MGKLNGRVALVTGAGRGIGQAVALKLASEGARLVVNDLDPVPTQDTVEKITAMGGKAYACPGSVTTPGFAQRFVEMALDAFGDIHVIVNNAGYTWDATIQKMSEEQFDAMIDVHLKAPWQIIQAAGEHIRAKAKDEAANGEEVIRKIVNVSSISGTRGNAGQSNYAAAKMGLVGLTKTMAKEWGRYKVACNAVAFGFIATRLTEATDEKKQVDIEGRKIGIGIPKANVEAISATIPMGRPGTPDEAAGSIAMMCYPESDYVSGQVIEVTGGN